MHTFGDVEDSARDLRHTGADTNSGTLWTPSAGQRRQLSVPGEGALRLPIVPEGYCSVEHPGVDAVMLEQHGWECLTALATDPGLVVPLEVPNAEVLESFGYAPHPGRRGHNVRYLGVAVAVDLPHGRFWGVGSYVAVEGGLRPGSTQVLGLTATWFRSQADAEYELAILHVNARNSVVASPESNSKPWKTITLLLGEPAMIDPLPRGWERTFRICAGLHRVQLNIRTNPDNRRVAIVKDLRNAPPNGLLVWHGGVASPEAYITPFQRAASTEAYTAILGGPEPASIEENIGELMLHLREFAPLASDLTHRPDDERNNWGAAAAFIRSLVGEHLALTPRADKMLDGNKYPDPSRMAEQMGALAALAAKYHEQRGTLGTRLAEVAQLEHGIEIALTDQGLQASQLVAFGGIQAEPHVKVDDFKRPNECGRIYFALDTVNHRFVVDHIGLHDYA